MEAARKRCNIDDIKAMLKQAGYGGERVVLMHPTDHTFYDAIADFNRALKLRGPSLSRPIGGGFTLAPHSVGREPGCHLALCYGRLSHAGGGRLGPICR
jgi:hypothetical protein